MHLKFHNWKAFTTELIGIDFEIVSLQISYSCPILYVNATTASAINTLSTTNVSFSFHYQAFITLLQSALSICGLI